jgi:DNA helicase HerA-like ATPase
MRWRPGRLAAFADSDDNNVAGRWTVGKLISINLGSVRTVGLVYAIGKPERGWNFEAQNPIEVSVELVGEVRDNGSGKAPTFDRSITQYPYIGAIAHRIRARDLQAVYDLGGRHTVTIGTLSQDATIAANIAIDETLNRHFAVVGTTGVGKSTAVSLLLRKAADARPDLRIWSSTRTTNSQVRSATNASASMRRHWTCRSGCSGSRICRSAVQGREIVPEELDLLRDIIPLAKQLYRNGSTSSYRRHDGTTADTPIPYRMVDLIKLIDERMGTLDAKSERPHYRMLKNRIDSAITDPRYRFMFGSRMIEDTIHQTISHIFRVEDAMLPITCFEMAGMPSEVVNAVCSVLARLAFDLTLWSEKRFKILLMCEEAHRYLPTDSRLGFAPTKEALSRIAKEGRKYGCYLGVITQRPGELDPTILSQCSTIFAMRLANEQDQAIIRSAIADSSASSLSFLSSMGQREAIAFGEGVATTMRLKFETLPLSRIPGLGKEHNADAHGDPSARLDVHEIVERMRNSQIRQIVATPEPEPVQQHSTLNSLLRRPIKPTLSDDDPNFGYGLRSGAFGSKTARSDFPLGLSAQLFRILRETRQAGLSKRA